jgi:hypothetical protein
MDNDIECIFDCKITNDDLSLINLIRFVINMIIGNEDVTSNWNMSDNLRNVQKNACNRLLQLIGKEREAKEEKYCMFNNKWNQIDPNELMHETNNNKNDDNKNYSYHSAVYLNDDENTNKIDTTHVFK